MAICTTCQSYYRQSPYNETDKCNDCVDSIDIPQFDEEDYLEVEHLLNPSGATKPVFYD